ncbi:hypothetical protein NPX13_g8827 [Xylaria arbuscula]|uniref:F-box domain-containing protein n=1 Tax=Xylaria arbuscula TaxID=114810 RepID=A0A9W8TI18_9PEZI|nr:hypothetical protein NPX13_g8827 [Xylaria arbuscula]
MSQLPNMMDQNSQTLKSGGIFESLPFELVMNTLEYLDDYKDLLNTMCASRAVNAVFEATPRMLLLQIARNIFEPEALQMALVAFYSTTDRLPFLRNDLPDPAQLAAIGRAEFQFPFELSFPKQESDIIDFFHFGRKIRAIADTMIAECHVAIKKELATNTGSSPSKPAALESPVPLSVEERAGVEKRLYQYEFLATTLNFDEEGNLKPESSSFHWRAWFLESIGSLEFIQLSSIEDWFLRDFRPWELEFHKAFFDNDHKASVKRTLVRAKEIHPVHILAAHGDSILLTDDD